MCSPGDSETIFTGKLMASLTVCHSTSSGTSGVANGFTTRKQTSVNGNARNSSNSSGERRANSTGMYNPPSGASPRNTAPRNEVSAAVPPVLRYLIANHQRPVAETPPATILETTPPYAAIRAAQPPATSHAPAQRNFAAAKQSDADNSAPWCSVNFPPSSSETLRAITRASERSNIVQSTIAARHRKLPDTPPSSAVAAGATNDSPHKSHCQSYPKSAIAADFLRVPSKFHPAWKSPPINTALPFPRTSPNPATPSTPPRR